VANRLLCMVRLNSGTKASPKYFHIGDRKENIIHCQMRNDASNLNLGPSYVRILLWFKMFKKTNYITILLSNRLLRLIKECTARRSFTF
jgi:hypothetical protein